MTKLIEIETPGVGVFDPEGEETFINGWRIQQYRGRRGALYERASRGGLVRWFLVEEDDSDDTQGEAP